MDADNSLDQLFTKYKLPIAMGVVGLVLLIGGALTSGVIPKTFLKSTKSSVAASRVGSLVASVVKVDVSGAVLRPGVYTLSSESRIEEALKAAGGVTQSADPVYLSKNINLAQKISDGMKIYIPVVSEAGNSASPVLGEQARLAQQVTTINVNQASLDQLNTLSGVGPVTSQSIIDKRPYSSIEELLTKKAVTRSVYEKIKGLVSVY